MVVLNLSTSAYVHTSNNLPAVFLTTDDSYKSSTELKDSQGNLIYNLVELTVILNETSNASGFVEKPVNFLDDNDVLLPRIVVGSPDVVVGKNYLIGLRYKFLNNNDGTFKYGETGYSSVFITTAPAGPGDISTAVRAEDSGVSINISSLYTLNSVRDGYEPIKSIRYYISKVGSTSLQDSKVGNIDLTTLADGTPVYDEWHIINNLENSKQHELAFRVVSPAGESILSDTFTITPSDLPSQIQNVKATNNFNDLINNNVTESSSSTISVYWSKPSDYDNLKSQATGKPVINYTIRKQEVVWNNDNSVYQNVGAAVETVLPHDAYSQTRPNYELTNPITDNNIVYHYVHRYEKEPSDYGKIFRFTVLSSNSNGSGTESPSSNLIAAYINPSIQEFTLEHQTEPRQTIGIPVTVYNGKLDLVLTTLSEMNGMQDNMTKVNVANVYEADGVTEFQQSSVIMHLHVASNEPTSTLIFDDNVTFVQQYTKETKTFVLNGVPTDRDVATPLDEWRLNDLTNIQNFVSLNLGVKYKFKLERIGTDPLAPLLTLKSIPNEILRTYFKSPQSVKKIQAYAINDDFTPILVNGMPGVRIRFEQITELDMQGTQVFKTPTNHIEYEARSNSSIIQGLERIAHDDSLTTREFVIPSPLGVLNNLYVRVYIKNPELDTEIEGEESSPAVSEASRTYLSAITDLKTTVDTNGTSVKVEWNKQSISGLGGFNSNSVINRVMLYNDSNPAEPVQTMDVMYSSAQTHTFTNLTIGDIYKIYVLSIAKYSKTDLDNSTPKFVQAEIRNFYATTAINAVGLPGKPANIETYPSSDKITFNYDSVLDSELRGNNSSNFTFNFIVSSDPTYFPYQDPDRTLLQAHVVSVSGTDEAIVRKAYLNVADSNSRDNAVDLVSETLYRYAAYVVSNVGNDLIENTIDSLDSTNGTSLTLHSVERTPVKEIMGEVYESTDLLYINNNVPKPEISATAGEESITLAIKKPANPPSELVIVFDNNDAQDKQGNPIPIFSTINVREANNDGNTGLFSLESTNLVTNPIIGNIDYGSTGYNFRVISSSGTQTYYITFNNLENGRLHNIQVRFANTFSGYDYFGEVASVEIAAEAPPTEPRFPSFTIDDKLIILRWFKSLNSGGAGLGDNSDLLYEITVKNGNTQLLQVAGISDVYYRLDSSNFPAITNGTTYSVEILAYYVKSGNNVKSIPILISEIKPNVAPVSPTVSITRGDNKLVIDITTVSSTQSTLYPLSSILIFIKPSNSQNYPTTAEIEFDKDNFLINSGSKNLAHTITNLLNGLEYDVKIVSAPNYIYAQPPTDVIQAKLVPFGKPEVLTSSASRVTGNNRAIDLKVNLNGSGNISQIIALGKSLNSNIIGILNLSKSENTLPTITRSGTATAVLAGNQEATFRLDFGSTIPSSLNDSIIIVSTDNSSDAGAYSFDSNNYFAT